ncbi:hypothetical protein K438DRAFT_2147528 [Mycena galopus ATCC 62051]|nr:hypothetical protein K438DRAFT_2147528 [Mycena galopus ATCC 62051]
MVYGEYSLLPPAMSEYLLYTAPILAGTQANWALLATLAVQVYTFYTHPKNERRWIKILVYTVFPLELAQTGMSSHYAYWVLALGWGNTTIFDILPWSCLATPVCTGITAALVQIFFAWRIYFFMHKTIWACVVTAIIILFARATAFTNVMKIRMGVKVNHPSFSISPLGSTKVWLVIAAVCDVLITTTLIIIFSQYRMSIPSEERRTNTLMVKLMLNTVETGAVTTFTALIYLVLFLLYPQYNLEEIPYANVLLFTLNDRDAAWGWHFYLSLYNISYTHYLGLHWLAMRSWTHPVFYPPSRYALTKEVRRTRGGVNYCKFMMAVWPMSAAVKQLNYN